MIKNLFFFLPSDDIYDDLTNSNGKLSAYYIMNLLNSREIKKSKFSQQQPLKKKKKEKQLQFELLMLGS